MKRAQEASSVFDEGIRFECTRCGQCCTGAPGAIVAASDEELATIARDRKMDVEAFRQAYVRRTDGGLSLKEKENGDCVFWDQTGCSIYEVRPTQCRTYPFWFKNLRSSGAWAAARRACAGIGRGRLYEKDEILGLLHQDMNRLGERILGATQSGSPRQSPP